MRVRVRVRWVVVIVIEIVVNCPLFWDRERKPRGWEKYPFCCQRLYGKCMTFDVKCENKTNDGLDILVLKGVCECVSV